MIGAANSEGLAIKIAKLGLSVRQTEALVKKDKAPRKQSASGAPWHDPDTAALERTISDLLGLKVNIEFRGEKVGGRVTVHYGNLDQLDEVVRRLGQVPNL